MYNDVYTVNLRGNVKKRGADDPIIGLKVLLRENEPIVERTTTLWEQKLEREKTCCCLVQGLRGPVDRYPVIDPPPLRFSRVLASRRGSLVKGLPKDTMNYPKGNVT